MSWGGMGYPNLRLEHTNTGKGMIHPGFFIIIIVILVTDNPTIQIGRSRAVWRGFGVRIGRLGLDGVGG